MNDVNPDYVVFGGPKSINYEMIEKASRLVMNGAKLIGTNPDLVDPSEDGIIPACRALIAPIELTTGKKPYYGNDRQCTNSHDIHLRKHIFARIFFKKQQRKRR
jgi:ribonucleotide monophosphatase NagD (HAD superfamily)